MEKIRTAVVGAGKMGAIHAKVYNELPQSELAAIVDIKPNRAKRLAERYGCKACQDCSEILGKVDAVTVATPTESHRSLAELFIKNNIAVMVEKPLAVNTRQGKSIVKMARHRDSVLATGHSERCNPAVQAIKRLNIEPKFIEANRISPYPFRSTDVGVVLDVMIHDIDIVLSMAASKIKRIDAVGVNVIEDNEDICNARIVFENGCVANLTASRLALKTERKVRVFSRQAYLSVDYFKKSGIVIKSDPNIDMVEWIRERKKSGDFDFTSVNWPDLLHIEELEIGDQEPLIVEQKAFLRAVADKSSRPEVTGEDGLAALQCAERILRSVRKHRWE